MQKPAILASKELGYNTVVIDADAKAVCVPLADKFYQIDLKAIWETHYQNISFPQFKFWYFNNCGKDSRAENKVDVMPEIRDYIFTRQKVSIEVKKDLLLCDDDDKHIQDVMMEKVISVNTHDDQEKVAQMFSKYNFKEFINEHLSDIV